LCSGDGRTDYAVSARSAERLAVCRTAPSQTPDNTYHRVPRARLSEMMPSWPWVRYFEQMGALSRELHVDVALGRTAAVVDDANQVDAGSLRSLEDLA